MNPTLHAATPLFEVRYASLFKPGNGYAFPCDDQGHVDLDALSERARNNYLFARATVGRDTSSPRICRLAAAKASAQH